MAEIGRPTEFDPTCLPKVKELAKDGATCVELADYLGVSVRTFYRWRSENREFRHAVKLGKAAADERVERALFAKATGFEHDSEKIFCSNGEVTRVKTREIVPPSDTAMIFWLKNRKPKEWRDKTEVDIPGLTGLAERIAMARRREPRTIQGEVVKRLEDGE